jgi:predicted DNA binding protein
MNNEPMTLREIADSEGISHQAIAEILERALKKMQKALETKGIKMEDLL